MARVIDESGNRYGRLTVVARSKLNSEGRQLWLCQCDCGQQCEVQSKCLRRKTTPTRSCGCYRKEDSLARILVTHQKFRKNSLEESSWKRLYKAHVRNARQRNIDPLDYASWKIQSAASCYYCSRHPPLRTYAHGSDIYANGVDRIDSSKGYEIANCVPCCEQCNKGKMEYSQQEFFDMCLRVVKTHSLM